MICVPPGYKGLSSNNRTSIPADFPFSFADIGIDTRSICASIRFAEQKIITKSNGTFITK